MGEPGNRRSARRPNTRSLLAESSPEPPPPSPNTTSSEPDARRPRCFRRHRLPELRARPPPCRPGPARPGPAPPRLRACACPRFTAGRGSRLRRPPSSRARVVEPAPPASSGSRAEVGLGGSAGPGATLPEAMERCGRAEPGPLARRHPRSSPRSPMEPICSADADVPRT